MTQVTPEQYLHQLSEELDTVHFLEIGAMDGKSFDLLHSFVHKHRWQGLLVEPLPDLFRELKEVYADCDWLAFENVAITEAVEDGPIFRIPQEAIRDESLPGWVKGISSLFNDRNALGGNRSLLCGKALPDEIFNQFKNHIVEEIVSCMPLKQLLEKHDIQYIDVLQIDTVRWPVSRSQERHDLE